MHRYIICTSQKARSRYPDDKFGFLEPLNRTGRPPPPSDPPGHYIWTTKNIWPSGHFGDAVVNVLQDPPYCGNEFTRSNCSSLGIETKACAPTGESEYNSQGYHIRTTCNGEIVDPRNMSSSEANSANVRTVSGTVATLCPAMCKDEKAWHNIIIDVNTIFMGGAAAETTDEMSVEMDESYEDGGGGGNGTNSSDFDDLVAMAKLLPSAIKGERECHLIVKVGSSFTLGNLVATVNSSNAGISGASNPRYIRANPEELEVSIDSNTFEGAVDIKGSRLNLRARSMTASSVSVSVEGGIVDLDNVEVHDTAAGIAVDVTHDGDIIISPKGPVVADLEWKQPCGYVCLPQGYWVDDSECNVEEEDEELGPGATSSTSTTTTTRTTTTTTTITTTTTTTTLLNDGSNSTNSTDTPTDTPAARDPFQVRECQKRTACGSTVTEIQFLGFKSTLTELFAHPHWVHYDSKGPVPGSYTAKGSRYSNADGSGYSDDDGKFAGDRAEAPEASEAPGGYSHGDTRGRLRIAASAQIGSIYLHDSVRAARNALLEVTAAARSALNPSAGSNRSISGDSDNATNNGYTMPPPPLGAKVYLPNQTQLSDKLKYDLAPLLNSSFSEYEDFVYRVLLSTFDPESFWLASTKEVYLQFEPGIIAAFSATVLNPWSAAFHGRLYPGFCPYRPEPSTYERGLVSELLVSAIEGFQNKSGATLGHRTKNGVWKYTKEMQSTEVDGALVVEQPFAEKEIHIRDNSYLWFAIILSLILAACGGIGITVGCVFGIKYVLIAFMRMKETNKRQLQFAKDKAKADSRPATARSGKEKDVKKKKKDQDDTGLSADPSAASPFELIDTLAAICKADYEDSLGSFAEQFFRDKPKAYSIAKRKFVEEYTQYCNKENATMSLIEESDWVMFTSLCVSRETRHSNSTEVFTNLKWRHVKDYPLVTNKKGITNPIEYFIGQRCVKSMFDYDYITTEAFRSKYDEFCIQHEIPKVPVQNRVMEDMGCKFERKTLTYLVKGREKIDSEAGFFSKLGRRIKNMCAIVYAWFAHNLFTLWLLQSFPSVFSHVVLSALIPLPLLLAAFIFQNAAENLTSVGHRYFLAQDAMIGPLPNTMYWGTNEPLDVTGWYIAKQNKALFYITLIFWGISMFELWAYYLGQIGKDGRNAKAEAKKMQRKEAEDSQEGRAKATLLNDLQESSACSQAGSHFVWFLGIVWRGIRKFIKILYMLLFMFFFAGTMSYIVLILVWAILGAIINPFKFLPLAAGALTLLTAVISKAKALQNAEKKMRGKIRAKMEKRAQLMMMQLREKVLAKVSGIADGITGGGGGGGGSGGSSPLVAMAKKHLGDLADDPELLLRVAKGDVKAISELSEKMGIDPMISRPIIAVAMKDVDELKRAIMPLAEKLGIDGALAGALIVLASDLNSGNKQRHLKTFMNEILKLAMCGKIPIPMPKIAHEIKRSLIISRQHTGAIQDLRKDDMEAMFNDAVNGGKEKLEQFERLAEESFNAMQDLAEDAAKRQMESVIGTIQNQKDRPELAQFGVLLGALPEIASCVLQIVEARDIKPFINLIETNRELQKVLPFPTEIISIANAILKSNRDKLQIEAIKLFAFLFGFKKLHTFLNSGSMLEEGLEAGEKSVMSFAGFLEAKVAEIMTDRAQILQAALAEKLTEELGKVDHEVDGAEAEAIRLKIKKTQAYALKLMGAAEGTVLNLVESAEGTIVQAVSKATDAANQSVGAMKTKLEGKVQKAKATAGAVKDKLEGKANAMVGIIEKRIRDLIPAELELMITLCALCYRDPPALEAACWISGETEDENLFHLNPSVARAIMMLAMHQEGASRPNPRAKPVKDGASPGTFRGKMKNQLPKSVQDLIRLDMRHKAIMPIAKQLGFDNQVLAGLVALPRDSATMRWARVNEIAGANTGQATFGLVALLNDSMGVGDASSAVMQLCYKCGIENNPNLVKQILKLRQQKFNRCQRTMHDFLVAISCPTHAKAAATGVNEHDFSDQCAAILALATATDARVLRESIKVLAMANGADVGSGTVKDRAQLSVAIAASRRYIPPLKGHELVKLFALVVPSSGYYENQTDLKCPFYDLTKSSSHSVKSPMQEYQLSYEEIRSVLNLDVDPTSDPHKLLAGALVKIIRSNKEWIKSSEKKEKRKSIRKPPTEAQLLTTIIEIRKAFNEEKLNSALAEMSSLCSGEYTGNDPETAPLVRRLAELQKCNAMSDKLAIKLKKCLGVETKTSVWEKQCYALLHMSEFKKDSGRVGMGKLAARKENFVQGAFSLTQGDLMSLEAIFDLSICVQGRYLGGSDMRILKTSVGKMCSLLAMPSKPMLHMICVSDPNPTEQTREVRVTMAASILKTHLNVSSKDVDKWKGLALASLKDVAYVHQSIIHVARKLRIPQELLFSLAHYSPSTSGRKADVRAVRAVMLPPAVHDDDGEVEDYGVGDRNIYIKSKSKMKPKEDDLNDTAHLFQNTYSDTSIGNPLVKTVSEAHKYKGGQKANRMQARKEDDTTLLFQTLVYNEIFDQHLKQQFMKTKGKKGAVKTTGKPKELNESTTKDFIVALSDRHMYIEGAISLATLDPVGVTTLCKALELAKKGAFKNFKFKTHGCALKLAVTLARRKLAELTETDPDYELDDTETKHIDREGRRKTFTPAE